MFRLLFLAASAALAQQAASKPQIEEQEEPVCVENSPERRSEIGCSIVESRLLPADLREPVFWHIDRFDSLEAAKFGQGPSRIALEAYGAWWLMSVGPKSSGSPRRADVA